MDARARLDSLLPDYGNPPQTTPWPDTDTQADSGSAPQPTQPIDIPQRRPQVSQNNITDTTWENPKRRTIIEYKRFDESKQSMDNIVDTSEPWISVDSAKMRRQYEFDQLHSPAKIMDKGDTLVFVDFPPHVQGKRVLFDCDGVPFVSQQVRVHSEKLLATDSSKFREMLNPTYQFRIQRRRKLVNKLPEGVKYVLDLTPPSEGDELVFQMTELSLTPGIANWWKSYRLQGVPYWLVKGHDDVCNCESKSNPGFASSYAGTLEVASVGGPITGTLSIPPTVEQLVQLNARHERIELNGPKHFDIPEYCPVRHCNCIIRLLMRIEGLHCTFDSAPRVWTTLGVAKIFDCARILIDPITTWMLHGTNSRFIEVLPEEALQIGFAVKAPAITESAFRILVNELALEQAADPSFNLGNKNTTIFGRAKGDAGDELNNLIQHAATAMVDRINRVAQELRDDNLLDKWDLPEWQKLLDMEQQLENAEQTYLATKALTSTKMLITAVRKVIPFDFDRVLREKSEPRHPVFISIDKDRATYASPETFVPCHEIITKLNTTQLMLIPFVYSNLDWERGTFAFGRSSNFESKCRHISDVAEDFNDAVYDYKRELSKLQTGTIDDTLAVAEWANCFSPVTLDMEARPHLLAVTNSWLRHELAMPLNLTLHLLLTLEHNEMKYLPLWAGGCDDGTGGVFEDFLPPAEMGPNGPGPSYHTGITVPSDTSSASGSLINGRDDLSVRGSTTAASVDVQDSISTIYRPDEVIADNESIAPSESFSMTDGADYNEARIAVDDTNESKQLFEDMMLDPPSDDDSTSTVTEQEFMSDYEVEQEPADSDAASSTAHSEDSFVVVQE